MLPGPGGISACVVVFRERVDVAAGVAHPEPTVATKMMKPISDQTHQIVVPITVSVMPIAT
jgi:hypothetical protein